MATRWTNRINPLSWVTRRRPRTAVVAPGGVHEFSTPAEYVKTTQDDYTAADRPTHDSDLAWFAESAEPEDDVELTLEPTVTLNSARPRTLNAGYNAQTNTLRVTFREGAVYDYPGITPEQWRSLQREHTSTGKWMRRNGIGGPGSGIQVK